MTPRSSILLILMDECTALGRIPILAEAISYLPGYNVRVGSSFKPRAASRSLRTHNAETMIKSLGARISFPRKDINDAKELSEELGSVLGAVRGCIVN